MKIFHFQTVDGNVDIKVDLLSSDLNVNATIMDIKYNITNSAMTSGYTVDQSIINFQNAHPVFANVKALVSSGAALKKIAVDNNFTLKMYDSSSPINNDGGDGVTTLNSSTTTTTTTHAPTTTTTTTHAPTTTTTTTGG